MPQLFQPSAFIRSNDRPLLIELAVNETHEIEYRYGEDVSGWNFTANTQTIVLDSFATRTDRDGNTIPVFGRVVGEIEDAMSVPAGNIDTADGANGNIVLTIPPARYSGNILPNYQGEVPLTVLTFIRDNDGRIENRTVLIVEKYAATVAVDEPSESSNFDPIADPPASP